MGSEWCMVKRKPQDKPEDVSRYLYGNRLKGLFLISCKFWARIKIELTQPETSVSQEQHSRDKNVLKSE